MLAMRLWKFTTAMAPLPQQRRHPAGVLHAALLLLCLALLMRASVSSAFARPVPFDNRDAFDGDSFRQPEEGGIRAAEVFPMEKSESNEDNVKECGSLTDPSPEPCVGGVDRRSLVNYLDYAPPGPNQNSHPGGPLP